MLEIFIHRSTVESESVFYLPLVTVIHAHVLHQIGLEDLSLSIKRYAIAFTMLVPISNVIINFLTADFVLYAKAVKEEHPLVHLELVDIELTHQFHNLYSLFDQCVIRVITFRLFRLCLVKD